MGIESNLIERFRTTHVIEFWERLWAQPESEQIVVEQQPAHGRKTGQRVPPPEFEEENLDDSRRQVRKIARSITSRMSHKRKRTNKHKQIDLRKTIALSRRTNGIPIQIKWKAKPVKKTRLIAVLDVSGSMEMHNTMMIQLLQSIKMELSNFELFIFADELEYVTPLVVKDYKQTINNLKRTEQWNGGTDIPQALETLSEQYTKLLNRNSIVIMLSDMGSYDSDVGAKLAAEIRRRVKRFYIFNTLTIKGYEDRSYEEIYAEDIQPYADVVDKVFDTVTLQEMAQAVKKVCLK